MHNYGKYMDERIKSINWLQTLGILLINILVYSLIRILIFFHGSIYQACHSSYMLPETIAFSLLMTLPFLYSQVHSSKQNKRSKNS